MFCFKNIQNSKDIFIQKSDQGSSAVISGKVNYLRKMENFLNDAAKFENIDLMSDRKLSFAVNQKKLAENTFKNLALFNRTSKEIKRSLKSF